MLRILALSGVVAVIAFSCGGSSGQPKAEEPVPPAASDAAPATADPEAKLQGQQSTTCSAMCERVTDCAVEDARASMSPEELAQLDLENTVPKAIEECSNECEQSSLSPRQLIVVRECLSVPTECPVFLECLDQAKQKNE